MAVYAIGDVQGCFDELQALLELIQFDPGQDQLWFTGDLVNRGPKSLETLRFVRGLGPGAVTVLGNHDLHLLAIAHGFPIKHDNHTMDDILGAPDRDELVDWLCHLPLLHHDETLGYTLVHAGLAPQWDLHMARQCAHEVEAVLHGNQRPEFLDQMYGDQPDQWSEHLEGWERTRFIVNCLTRIRFCNEAGRLEFSYKGAPGSQPAEYRPWFELADRASKDLNIIFGHWSTLGPRHDTGIYPVDSACLWGGQLTALRIDKEPEYFKLSCTEHKKPA